MTFSHYVAAQLLAALISFSLGTHSTSLRRIQLRTDGALSARLLDPSLLFPFSGTRLPPGRGAPCLLLRRRTQGRGGGKVCTAATIPWKEGGGGVGALPNMAPDKYISPLLHGEEEEEEGCVPLRRLLLLLLLLLLWVYVRKKKRGGRYVGRQKRPRPFPTPTTNQVCSRARREEGSACGRTPLSYVY